MRANLFSFFEDGNGQVLIQLAQLVGCSESCRPAADDQDIDFQGVTLGHVLRVATKRQKLHKVFLCVLCLFVAIYLSYFLKRRAAFVPPNPKEFESAYRTSALRALFGT